MEHYEWDETLASGNEVIDSQHRQLFQAVNDFAKACRQNKGATEIQRTLDFLINYTVDHFRDEEELQRRYGFPDYMRHRQYHREFSKVALGLAERLEREGPTEGLTREVYETAGRWLLHHIKSDDFVLAAYIKSYESGRN